MSMRTLCNLLIGIPIFGLVAGSILLVVQAAFLIEPDFGSWNVFGELLKWLVRIVPGHESHTIRELIENLPMASHMMISSILIGLFSIPAGLALNRIRE
jgi:vacuolar-type H+-ATPase subunit I/STV1